MRWLSTCHLPVHDKAWLSLNDLWKTTYSIMSLDTKINKEIFCNLLTLCNDVQHHSKGCQSSYHVQQSHRILDRKTLIPSPEIKETDEQWHQQGFQTMNHQRHQISVVIKYLPSKKKWQGCNGNSFQETLWATRFYNKKVFIYLIRIVNCCSFPGRRSFCLETVITDSGGTLLE